MRFDNILIEQITKCYYQGVIMQIFRKSLEFLIRKWSNILHFIYLFLIERLCNRQNLGTFETNVKIYSHICYYLLQQAFIAHVHVCSNSASYPYSWKTWLWCFIFLFYFVVKPCWPSLLPWLPILHFMIMHD